MEDKCFDQTHNTTVDQEQNDDDCSTECCSPFFSCTTCIGFVLTSFHFAIALSSKQPEKKLGKTTANPISNFPSSVWHPPKLA
ncbi:hypothetical protein [Sphingobacterium sp. JB170]|uniref:hypothetical protein n=1 Tax=Sphingobacterium sp. JB170 TaxID=1434842 RepID=UPI00211AA79F|nr:hypothetical protein [Sphingobacterium sp. JB170]